MKRADKNLKMLDHVITGDYSKKDVFPAIAREKDQGSEKEAIKNPSPGKTGEGRFFEMSRWGEGLDRRKQEAQPSILLITFNLS